MTELQYSQELRRIKNYGFKRNTDRTGVGNIFIPGISFEFNVSEEIPIIQRKPVPPKATAKELEWFIKGKTNLKDLDKSVHNWWSPWAKKDGDLGLIYGHQVRSFGKYDLDCEIPELKNGVEQLKQSIELIKVDPNSRRNVITLWNPLDLKRQQLACCHGTVIQFFVEGDNLSMFTYQRSGDMFLGVPVNFLSYTMLLYIVAKLTNKTPDKLLYTIGDAHIYLNHLEQVEEYLSRPIKPNNTQIKVKDMDSIDDFTWDKIEVIGYNPDSKISAPLAV